MHPGMIAWWKHARRHAHECGPGAEAHCGPRWAGRGHGRGHHEHGWEGASAGPHEEDGGGFGVRRPLRFLAFKLELEEKQVADLATILAELKTERAQAAVDNRRTTAAFADAIEGDAFDQPRVDEAGAQRVKSAEHLRQAVTRALGKIHALLDAEQRKKLAYLIRTGALSI
jgi:hypothetical protein